MQSSATFFDTKKMKREKERARGDGSCLLNAFILGLSQKHILEWLDKQNPDVNFAEFIRVTSLEFNVAAKWSEIRKILLQGDRNALQRHLQLVLRNISLDHAAKNPEFYQSTEWALESLLDRFFVTDDAIKEDDMFFTHRDVAAKLKSLKAQYCKLYGATIQNALQAARVWWRNNQTLLFSELKEIHYFFEKDPLLAELTFESVFERYLTNKSGEADQIFLRNEEIKKSFKEMKATIDKHTEHAKEALQDRIKKWWKNDGFAYFLTEMRRKNVYAGDVEVKQLGLYFGVNICYERGERLHDLCVDHGSIPLNRNGRRIFSEKQLRELCGREIIDPVEAHDSAMKLKNNDEIEIARRLKKVPNYKSIERFIKKHGKEGCKVVPFDFSSVSKECRDQMQIRGMTKRNVIDGVENFYLNIPESIEDFLQRANFVPAYKKILFNVKKYKINRPFIILANEYNSSHWDNMRIDLCLLEVLRYFVNMWFEKFGKNKWEKLLNVAIAKESAVIDTQKKETDKLTLFTNYHTPSGKDIVVSIKDQIALDEAYAYEIQKQELQAYDVATLKC